MLPQLIFTAVEKETIAIASEEQFAVGLLSSKFDGNRMEIVRQFCQTGNRIAFVDNPFKSYRHERYVSFVAAVRPVYATVRDIMSREMCDQLGIPYYDVDTILAWASELEAYADHIIVIPKVDVIDSIPAQYILGYSVPSSYASCPIPYERFLASGRRIHLLGGNPFVQFAYWSFAPDRVCSIDNNYLSRYSVYGNTLWFDPLCMRTRKRVSFLKSENEHVQRRACRARDLFRYEHYAGHRFEALRINMRAMRALFSYDVLYSVCHNE